MICSNEIKLICRKMNKILLLALALSALVSSAIGCTCGQENVRSRIINGREAEANRYPWQVFLRIRGVGNCGGSLINDRYILTAAHCFVNNPHSSLVLPVIGAHDVTSRTANPNLKRLQIEWYKAHPGFDNNSDLKPNDIALVKLKNPVQFDDKLNPICLPNFSNYSNLFVYGWGRQNEGQSQLKDAKVLHEVEVDEVDDESCYKNFWGYKFDRGYHICAGTKGGVCRGDSGGPLSTRKNGHVYQVGVVSWGIVGCKTDGQMYPDLYQRVTAHYNWIKQNTLDANWCKGPETPDFSGKKGQLVSSPPQSSPKQPTVNPVTNPVANPVRQPITSRPATRPTFSVPSYTNFPIYSFTGQPNYQGQGYEIPQYFRYPSYSSYYPSSPIRLVTYGKDGNGYIHYQR